MRRIARGLSSHGNRREARHPRSAVAHHDYLRRLLTEPLAHDELVAPTCRRDPRGGRPVDRVHVVARAIRARAGHIGAGSPAQAAHGRRCRSPLGEDEQERQTGVGHRLQTGRGPSKSGSSSEPGRGAISRQAAGTLRSPPTSRWRAPSRRSSACRRRGARGPGRRAVPVLGDDEGQAVDERPCAGGSLEGRLPPNGAPDHDRLAHSGRSHEVYDPTLEDVVDVDVLRGGSQRGDPRRPHDRAKLLEGMLVPLVAEFWASSTSG